MDYEKAWEELKQLIEWEVEFQKQKYLYSQSIEIKVALKKAEYFSVIIKHLEEKYK